MDVPDCQFARPYTATPAVATPGTPAEEQRQALLVDDDYAMIP
nr:hypothetical protein [Bradyrhizobium sp.]